MLEVPLASTRLVLPRGAPPSTMDFLFFSIHFIQPSMPVLCCSGVEYFIAFSKSAPEAMYKTMNFFIASSSCSRRRPLWHDADRREGVHRRPVLIVGRPLHLHDTLWPRFRQRHLSHLTFEVN